MTADPWAAIPPDVTVGYEPLDDESGYAVVGERRIVLDSRLTQRERRSALAHELVHHARGDVPCAPHVDGWFDRRQETAVEDAAAVWLIPLAALVDALRWSQDETELADHLWVDVALVRHRLARLSDAEKDLIGRLLWDEWRGA